MLDMKLCWKEIVFDFFFVKFVNGCGISKKAETAVGLLSSFEIYF